jgi:acyl-homoserine-lactone acylase
MTNVSVVMALAAGLLPTNHSTATIRYTEYDIPHIVAHDYRSLGYGQGYAAAKANSCTIADGVITLRGERSRFFGPGATTTMFNRAADNLTSDTYFKAVDVGPLLDQPSPTVRRTVSGYTAGYNAYLAERHPSACPELLSPMTDVDVYKRVYAWSTAMGSGGTADGIVKAAPGAAAGGALQSDVAGPGSNGVVLGRDGTATGRSIVVTNPHLPWGGDMSWDMVQLTIPGQLNISGATFVGLPFVIAGTNDSLSWSGTITDAVIPVALYELKLVDPTTYLVDGKPEKMRRQDVTVQVKQPDGTVTPVTKTLYSTRYGPVLTSFRGLNLPWTADKAYAMTDPNTRNLRFLNLMSELAYARTVDQFSATVHRVQGDPIFNLLAADNRGDTVYSGQSVVPNVPDALVADCGTNPDYPKNGLAVLDGSRGACALPNDPDAVQPGILGTHNMPELRRTDFTANSNGSYWLTNDREPMRQLPRIVGDHATARDVRTRDTLTEVHDGLGGFDLKSTQDFVFSNRVYAAELALDDTVAMCRGLPGMTAACDALANWDRRANVDSKGYLLFSRFWNRLGRTPDWKVPFDVKDPVHTPNTLNTDNPATVRAFTDAVAELAASGVPVDAPTGAYQYVDRNGQRFPIGGGRPETGTFNVVTSDWDHGYHGIGQGRAGTNSSGYVRVVAFNGTPCPDARAVLAYRQPELFSAKQWITERFCEKDILASPELKVVQLRVP